MADEITLSSYALGVILTITMLGGILIGLVGPFFRSARLPMVVPNVAPVETWRDVLKLPTNATLADAEKSFRVLARAAHPDYGGSYEAMAEISTARDQARAFFLNDQENHTFEGGL